MSLARHLQLLAGALALAILSPSVRAGESAAPPARLREGARFSTLTVGKATYEEVRVRTVTVRSLIITHRGGMASLRLRDLPPGLQQAFGYSPTAEAEADAAEAAAHPAKPAGPAQSVREEFRCSDRFATMLRRFGQPPDLRPAVDLRPRYNALGLFAKNQGRRPSCAIFAVVSALEYQSAEVVGRAEKLSEEYIIWATRKALGRAGPAVASADEPTGDEDLGFSVIDVVMALRAYGIPAQDRMPNTLNRKMGEIAEPDSALVDEARRHVRAAIYPGPVDRRQERVGNLVHALNAGIPVVVSMDWPYEASIRAGYLDQQAVIPGGGHAVTLVGYTCEGGSPDRLTFIFRNSWGVKWGQAGYGLATSRYLQAHLRGAFLLEVQP